MIQIYNDDCFNQLHKIKSNIDLVLVDLPYGQTDCDWDKIIDLNRMWEELKKICKKDCIYIFFTTTKFGNKLINSNEKWFRYDLVWEKSRTLGFLNANKAPLRKHEMVYIFCNSNDYDPNKHDLNNERNLGLRAYAEKVKTYINKPIKKIDEVVGNQGIHKFYSFKSSQFSLPTEKTYNILIDKFKLTDMIGFREYKSLKEELGKLKYNPQKTKGKPYIAKCESNKGVYGKIKRTPTINKGDRHPTSVLKFNNPKKSIHPTQKPTDLCEWLIKTYSNENDIVLDFTMGSGSTGIACLNTNRHFIGIEKDEDIFNVAKKRLFNHEIQNQKINL